MVQLDALEIDEALEKVIFHLLEHVYPYQSQYKHIVDLSKFVVHFYIVLANIYVNDSTYGMQQLNLRFDGGGRMARLVYPVSLLLGNCFDYFEFHSVFSATNAVGRAVKCVRAVIKAMSVVNFVLFLNNARYPNLLFRLLRLQFVYRKSPIGARRIGFEYANRELLWHSFNELITYFMPIYRAMLRNVQRKFVTNNYIGVSDSDWIDCPCFVCNYRINNARRLDCGHYFCYYCCENDVYHDGSGGYLCPVCARLSLDCSAVLHYDK